MGLRVNGSPSQIAVGQLTLTGSAQKLVDARPGRTKLFLQNTSGGSIGPDNSVTASNGFLLSGLPAGVPLETAAEVWVIGPVNALVSFIELYDDT